MQFGTSGVQRGRFARRGLAVVGRTAALLCAFGLCVVSVLAAQGTPAGTRIRAWAVATFDTPSGSGFVSVSDTAEILVGQVAGADVEPPRVSSGAASFAILFAHTVTNVGNGADSFALAGVSGHGWPVTLYRDLNSDGILDPTDLLITAPLALGYGAVAHLLAQVAIPSNAGILGATDTVTIIATSRFDAAVSDTVRDRLDVPVTALAISLAKQVDRATALAGDLLTYTIDYTASVGAAASNAQFADTIPAGTSYVAGTLRWNGTPLTDGPGDDAGVFAPAGNGAVGVDLGSVVGGATGTVTFQVRVNPGLPRTLTNRGYAVYASAGTTDTAYTNAVQTSVLAPLLVVSKQLVGPSQALVGQQVHYTLRYGAAVGGAPVANTVLTDTLPAGLDYLSATPAASVAGPVLSWALGTLAPGDSGVIDLVLQVNGAVRDTVWARNVGTLAGTNAATQSASAAQLALIGPSTAAVGLDLTANVLEVGVGEVIPYTEVVRNSGLVAISDIRIDNTLPAGGSYARGTARGADSVLVAGNHVILVSTAPLAPGETRSLHYAVALASATGTVAEARATANATAGALQPVSPQAVAWVQIRRAWPMETRAAIGKVWIDRDGHGGQQSGDSGLAGVDIWTEDGQVATTDSTGKFSFANLRPGRHAFRLDSRTLPPGYRVAGDDIQGIEASGWTTPRVDFRVAPAQAQPAQGARPDGTTDAREVRNVTPRQLDSLIGLRFTATPVREAHAIAGQLAQLVRYEVTVNKGIDVPLDGMVEFFPVADSAVVFVHDTQFTHYTWLGATAIPLPAGVPRGAFRIVAWSRMSSDSATATLVVDHTGFAPQPDRFAARAAVEVPEHAVVVAARVAVAQDSVSAPRLTAPRVPSRVRDPVTVPLARVRAATLGGQQSGLVLGTGINIFAPVDGTVLAGDRVYVGVKGEAGMPVVLYDGAKAIDSAQIRVDGVYDFVAVPLSRGPHLLRVRAKNSWGNVGWDSIAVHVTGLPAQFATSETPIALLADGYTVATANVRVLDAWGVPVVQPAYVTVNARGAEPIGHDADPSSVGLQLLSDSAGWLVVSLRPGRAVSHGVLELKAGDAKQALPLEILPAVRPLMVTGSGLVGVGASPDAYGAITARGQLGPRTSLTLGLDSRRLNDGQLAFGRSADPLNESQYPILGDASHLETRTASHNWFSARLERGFNWAAFGDLATADFARGLTLAQYGRAVTGLATRVTTGAVTWSGFGSFTAQSLRQLQIRGAGVSGPYTLGTDVLPGTDVLRIETRDALNPERAVATQALTRFVDYEIDYTRGVVLFKQPIPAADASGNPLFIVATFEAASGGVQRLVAGARAALDVRQLAGGVRLDSLRIGLTAVNADQAGGGYRLVGGDVRALRIGALDFSAEIAYAERGDSAGFGTLAKASYRKGPWTLGLGYMRIDREFTNPANVALQPGLTELTFKSGLKLGAAELRAEHSSQQFALQGIGREHSRVSLVEPLRHNLLVDAGVANDQVTGSLGDGLATTAGVKTKWSPSRNMQLWGEAQHHLSLDGQQVMPDFWGFGAAYRLSPAVGLEAGQRFVSRPDSQSHYSVTSVGVRADVGHGTEAWGSYQLSGGINGAGNAALVGLRNRLQLTPSLALNVLFERRMGVAGAAVADPVRALPFLQPEGNYWSFAAGMELLPARAPYRLSARGEYKDGTLQSSRLVTVAGDVAFDASLALLTRQQFSQNALPGTPLARQMSSLWGLAFRPAHSDRLNMLAKFQWTDARNPIGGGVLVSQGAEQRAIAAAEMIWTPARMLEVGTRYAMRRTQTDGIYPDGTPQALVAWADYVGSRVSVTVSPLLSVRGDGRLLIERSSGATRWDASPTLALRPLKGLEIATGYRFGDLSDPDFSVRGGHGLFLTVSAALTEKLFSTAAEFWRARL